MKKLLNWQVFLGAALIALSALVYYIHYLIFRDMHHIFIYLIGDVAFVFVEVLLVTLLLHQLLSLRDKKAMLKKLNMVIGAFYSEVGIELLDVLSSFDPNAQGISEKLIINSDWTDKKFLDIHKYLKRYNPSIKCKAVDLESIKKILKDKREFLLRLLENPNLLEHDSFTNLLWAVFHLTEELVARKSIHTLGDKDCEHILNDIKRAYTRLISEWVDYMKHLKSDYPYLFSLAMRTNPFDSSASAEVR